MRLGVKPGQWGWSFEDLRAAWGIAEDCGFQHISCFDHVSASPQPLASWDACGVKKLDRGGESRTGWKD
ncbi:MAG TPA: hypothetical protein VEQ37_08200 [Actinomycetota bacterium]|nr:hypothetical protein [Actinomycetota bacterium]